MVQPYCCTILCSLMFCSAKFYGAISVCRISTCVLLASKRPVILIQWSSSASILMTVLRHRQQVPLQVIAAASPHQLQRHGGRITPSCLLMHATAVMPTACAQAACACKVLCHICVVAIVSRRDARRVGRCCCCAVSMLDRVQKPDVRYHSVPRSVKTRIVGDGSRRSSRCNLPADVLPT